MGDTSTTLLGQVTDEHADEITARLEDAGIVHWVKRSGGLTRVLFAGDWGVRIFVDEARLADATAIAREVLEG